MIYLLHSCIKRPVTCFQISRWLVIRIRLHPVGQLYRPFSEVVINHCLLSFQAPGKHGKWHSPSHSPSLLSADSIRHALPLQHKVYTPRPGSKEHPRGRRRHVQGRPRKSCHIAIVSDWSLLIFRQIMSNREVVRFCSFFRGWGWALAIH